MLFVVTVSLLLGAPELPEVCRPPPLRDVASLGTLAQRSGALSVGLDSVATWCFDSAGTWTGGAPVARALPQRSEPVGDCAKALATCRQAHDALSSDLTALLADSLRDLERPFLGARYTPKRSGLSERPLSAVECSSRQRAALFAQAQARMDWARLASQAQSEYANYRTWLFSEGLRCAEAVAHGTVDPTNRGLSVDHPVSSDGGVIVVPSSSIARSGSLAADGAASGGQSEGALAVLGVTMGASVTMESPSVRSTPPSMQVTWQAMAAERAKIELDEDWVSGFLVSRELRACRCNPLPPSEVLRRLELKEYPADLEADDERNVRCERCLQDAFVPWKSRVNRQCLLMARLTDFELGVLERSDDGNGLPPRCFASARAQRSGIDAGIAGSASGAAFIITRGPEAARSPREPDPVAPAPAPPREDGRSYLRLYMSATCVAEIEPGPIQLRTGDLLPVPFGAPALWVRSACGGVAEVYWGREEKPRVSETFGRNQPLELRFPR